MKKLTRIKSNEFLQGFAETGSGADNANGKTLIVGAGSSRYEHIFPGCLHTDIDPSAKTDMVADAEALPFPENSFDTVVCPAVLSHVRHPQKAVDEMHRVLKPGGRIILTTAFIFPLNSHPVDYWRITENGLQLLFSNGWNIETFESDSKPFYTIAVLMQRIIFQTDVRGGKFTKGLLYGAFLIISKLDFLIKKQYGDIGRSREAKGFLTGGWLFSAHKVKEHKNN